MDPLKNELPPSETLIDEVTVLNIFYPLVLGLKYLHEHEILHRDIKP